MSKASELLNSIYEIEGKPAPVAIAKPEAPEEDEDCTRTTAQDIISTVKKYATKWNDPENKAEEEIYSILTDFADSCNSEPAEDVEVEDE